MLINLKSIASRNCAQEQNNNKKKLYRKQSNNRKIISIRVKKLRKIIVLIQVFKLNRKNIENNIRNKIKKYRIN